MTAAAIIKAHQYLYYVQSNPLWTDLDYDAFCHAFGIQGGGGSDCASHYAPEIVRLAEEMCIMPHRYTLAHCILQCAPKCI